MASTSKWTLDYTSTSSKSSPSSSIRDPPGYIPTLTKNKNATSSLIKPANLDSLRQQKAWELALAPAKNVPMQAFMMYMTGGGVQIFSVMSVWFLLKQAVTGIFSVEKAFAPYTSPTSPRSLTQQKLIFIACQFGLLLVGLWKCNNMGLLPTHESDWLAFRPRGEEVRSGLEEGVRGWERGRGWY